MAERPKAVLLDIQLVVSFGSHLKKIKEKRQPIPAGEVFYRQPKHNLLPENKPLLPSYVQKRSVRLKPRTLSFIYSQLKSTDIYIGDVVRSDVDKVRKSLQKAGLSNKNIKSFFPQGAKGDEIAAKDNAIRKLRKRYQSQVIYYSDNEEDVLALARKHQEVQFRLVQSQPSGRVFSGDDPPNLHRIAKLPEAVV